MAYQLTQDCIDMDVEMSATAHSVLVVLCRHANDAGECFPTTALIAKKAHLNPRTVMQAVKELEQGAWISSTQTPGKRRRFLIDGAKIQSFVPSEGNSTPAESYTPAGNCTPVKRCSTPLQETAVHPCRKLQDTPAGNCTRIEHIREQEKDREDSCARSAGSSATDLCPSVDEFGLTNDYPVEAPKTTKQTKTKKPKAITHAFDLETLPKDWAVYCKEVRPDLDPARVFSAFKAYWTMGRGKGTLRADKSWFQSWAKWVKKENEGRGRGQADEGTGMLPDKSRNPFYFPDGGSPNRKTTEVPRDYDATAEASDLVGRMLG